ncbi:hypothetical protein V8F33_010490 [Rhypophila sp. PSN 637]
MLATERLGERRLCSGSARSFNGRGWSYPETQSKVDATSLALTACGAKNVSIQTSMLQSAIRCLSTVSIQCPKKELPKMGYTINKYLNSFANDFHLTERIKLETSVTNVSRSPLDDSSWILTASCGPQIHCAKLIWAWSTQSKLASTSPKFANVSRATVVGSSKSSLDTVYLLLKAGEGVDLIIREDGAGPLVMAVPTLFGVWNIVDVISSRTLASFSPSIMNTKGVLYHAIQRTKIGRMVAKGCWRFVTWFSDRAAGYGVNGNMKKLRPTPKGYAGQNFLGPFRTGHSFSSRFLEDFYNGDVTIYRSEIESLSNTGVVNLKNGVSVQSDMVIACTGFEKPYRPFSKELREELGLSYSVNQVTRWAELDARGNLVVDEKLLFLKENTPPLQPLALPLGKSFCRASEANEALLHGPNRHYPSTYQRDTITRMTPLLPQGARRRAFLAQRAARNLKQAQPAPENQAATTSS